MSEKITNVHGKELKYLSLEIKENIGIITINRPPMNILTEETYTEVGNIFDYVNELLDKIYVVIFRAETKSYPVGLDVSSFKTNIQTGRQVESANIFYKSTLSVYNCKVPVISAVHGNCLGGGLCYAAGSDFIISTSGAKFGIPEVKLSVVGGSCHLSRLVPHMVMRYMAYTGTFLTAEEMRGYGAVIKVVPNKETLDKQAWDFACELKSRGPLVLRHIKETINEQENFEMDRKNQLEIKHTAEMAKTEDLVEGINSFFEKRNPEYKGM